MVGSSDGKEVRLSEIIHAATSREFGCLVGLQNSQKIDLMWFAMCSDIRIPSDGELHMYSPGSTLDRTVCERDCMRVGPFDVPHSHKLTTPLLQGMPTEFFQY